MDRMGECFSQCFEAESSPRLVRFLKLEWNISSNDDPMKFERMFLEKMTEPTCMGDERWHEDIGHNRMEWRCNSTCQKNNLCHKHAVFDAYRNECEQACRDRGGHQCWEACSPWSNKAVCTSKALREFVPNFNTTWLEDVNGGGGRCEPLGLQTPCGCDHCYEPCHTKEACEATSNDGGGTFFQHSSNHAGGTCCPNGKFIHTRTGSDTNNNIVEYKECKQMAMGTPNGWEVRNEACCRGFNGMWNGAQGHCCFGLLKTECDWKGECQTHCEEHVNTWESCEQCAEATCKHEDCKACEEKWRVAVERSLLQQTKQLV